MPIFDKELINNNIGNTDLESPTPELGSPSLSQLNPNITSTPIGVGSNLKRNLSLKELSDSSKNAPTPTGFGITPSSISQKELLENQRYPIYQRNTDLEQLYALQQPWYNRLANGTIKMGATAIGTFAQSFATIPNTISAIKNGEFSKLSGEPDGYESSIDNWLKNLEDNFPNYYSRYEKQHPYLSIVPGFTGSANFWGDKIIKNLGFTAGAIGGALAQDAIIGAATEGLGEIPLVANQIGKASLYLNKIFTGTNKLDEVLTLAKQLGKSEQSILNIEKLGQLAAATKLTDGFRWGTSIYGSARTEAAIEARDGYRQVKDELTKQYKLEHGGDEPDVEAQKQIDEYSEDAMNTRFGINMALLTVSNAIQFGNLFKSYNASEKAVQGALTKDIEEAGKIGLQKGSLDIFEKKAPESLTAKLWDSVRPSIPNLLSEGVYEEGGQYAAEKGTYDYYTRKYKNPKDKNWDTLNETVNSTVKGLKDQFGTTEGIENMVVGAISAMISGAVMNRIDHYRGEGKDARLQSSINILNRHALTSTLEQQYDNTLNSIGIANEMKDAIASKDVFKYKNLKDDMFFNFVMSRVPSGMHDVTIDQLNMLKDLPKEDFEKTFGMDFNSSNKATVASYVDELVKQGNSINKIYQSVDSTFRNPFNKNINPKNEEEAKSAENFNTFNSYKTELTYLASKIPFSNDRLSSIQESVYKINPLVTNELLQKVTSKQGLEELNRLYEEKANQINDSISESISTEDRKSLKSQVKSFRNLSERINLALNTKKYDDKLFDKLINFELNDQIEGKDRVVSPEQSVDLINYGHDINRLNQLKQDVSTLYDTLSSKEGFVKYFEDSSKLENQEVVSQEQENTQPSPTEFVNSKGEKEPIQIGSEYEISSPKLGKIKKIAEDRWEVESPYKESSFYKTEERAKEALDEQSDLYKGLKKVKVLAINPDNTLKVEDSKENIYNIDAVRLSGYNRILTEQEKLQKFKSDIKKNQDELEKNSGDVATTNVVSPIEEEMKKSSDKLFISSTSISEDWESTISKPHIVRTNEFLNNVKNFKNYSKIKVILTSSNQEAFLGLSGLSALSYKETGVNSSEYTNIDNGLIAAVYVEQEGDDTYFINKDGKRIGKVGESIDINSIVFSTMPTTSLTWSNGKDRYRAGEREEAIEQSNRWKLKREQLFSIPQGKYETYGFSISRGIPIITSPKDRFAIGNNLIPEDKISTQKGLITISVTGNIVYQGENLKFPLGVPLLQYNDTLQWINSNTFNKNQANSIFEVMKSLSEDVNKQLKEGKGIKLNKEYATFLQNVLYWRKSSNTSKNQIFIDENTSELFFSGKRYDLTNIKDNEKEIVDTLQQVFININNKTLKDQFEQPFTEYYAGKDNDLLTREWKNYQTYLLSSKYPDGTSRNINDIPVSTSVNKPTESIPYNFKQKYITLQGVDLPIISNKQPIVVKELPKIGEYIVDGTTENIYNLNSGPVNFTATVDDNNDVSVSVTENETIAKIADNKDVLNGVIIPMLKGIGRYTEGEDNKKVVLDYVATRIAFDLQRQLPNKEKTPAKIIIEGELPSEQKRFSNTAPEESEYRKIGEKGEPISDEELQLFKQWHKENTPNIPYEILENILITNDGEKAWGAFENNVAKFYKGALKGTEYHEVFEGVWKSFLLNNDKQAILDEFKAKKGLFTDRQSGKKIAYDQATDLQAKERIADDFAEFRLGKLPARSIGEKILRFFRSIIEFVKQFINKPSEKQELFRAIDTGKFKESTIKESPNSFSEYRKIGLLSEQQTNDFVQDITARFFQDVFGTNKSLYSPELITSNSIFSKIRDKYKEEGKLDNTKAEVLNDEEFNALVERTKDFLRTFKIDFDENDVLTVNDEQRDSTLYAPEPFSTNWKKSSPFPVKLLVGTLTETLAQNQENQLSLNLPKQKLSSVYGYKLLNFSRAFATLLDKLSNTTKVGDVVNKLLDLSKYDSNYVRLFTRLKGDRNTLEIDFSKFEPHDWRLFVNFYQTFTKQKPDAYIQYIREGEVYSASANLFTNIKNIQQGWISNIRQLANTKDSLIKYNKSTKTFQVDDLSKVNIKTPQQQIEFLSKIGIDFPMEVYLRLKDSQIKTFADSVGSIYSYIGKEKDLLSITGKTLQINAPLNNLAELLVKVTNPNQDISYNGIEGKKRQSFSDNNAASIFENQFNSSKTIDELLSNFPQLNDVFSKNSQILKKGGLFFNEEGKRIKKIKVGYIQGTSNIDGNKDIAISKLSLGGRFTQEINQNLNGRYYILLPADSSTEWMMDLGNSIKYEEVENGKGWNKVYNIFKGYLNDDIALSKEDRSYLKNVGNKARELRFFKDILASKELDGINKLIKNDASEEEINTFINDNISNINSSIKEFIQNMSTATIDLLKSNNEVIDLGEDKFSYPKLDDNFAKSQKLKKSNLSTKELNDIIDFSNINYTISNIEFHKVLFGDPFQFAIKNNKLDETKRIKSFLSPRRVTFDSVEFNNYLNQNYNKVENVELFPSDIGYHEFKSFTNTSTLEDINIVGSISSLDVPKEIKDKYLKTNEADAASWVLDTTYREIKLKNGQWSEEAEKWHQWQLAYTRQNILGYKYQNPALEKTDKKLISSKEPIYLLDVLKPIVSGVKNNTNSIDNILDKFSQMPIYYKAVKGTNLENLYLKMFKEKIGYVIVESGRKVGTEQLHPLYTPNGEFNNEPFNNKIEVPWSSYGIQVENAYDGPKEQTRGSQLTKLSSLDLFNNGVPSSEEAKKEYERNKNILNLMHKNAYKNLLDELGIEDLDGVFQVVDNVSVSQTLKREMLKREMSENAKDILELNENGEFRIPFEASTNYVQIRDILFSMVDKALISPKMNGGAHVQVPVTLWEKSGEGRKVVEINGKKVLTDATLKFYTKEEPYCEILLPIWFKNKLDPKRFKTDEDILNYLNNTEDGKNILKGIGFRIPTQSQSSTEVFKVKGFIPEFMGRTVVVPSEITTKAGSDFDIDKLNMYLKSVYTDENGDIKLVKYKNSEEETKDFYKNVYENKIEKEINKIEKFDDFRNKTLSILETIESMDNISLEGIEFLLGEEDYNFYTTHVNTIQAIVNQALEQETLPSEYIGKQIEELSNKKQNLTKELLNSDLKDKYIKEMYKRSLENEYYDSLEKLITLPENFERLISPVDDAGLKKMADKLDKLKGEDENDIKNRILNRNYMTSLRHAFLMGKKWVGIGAVNITGQSLTQKSKIYIDVNRFSLVKDNDRKFLGDGEIALPHNTTEVEGTIHTSISGVKSQDGEYISDRLSGYITSFVDVAKDPYILKIIKSDLAVGVFMFLERIGVGKNTILFMNQPIIEEYLKYLDSINSKNLFNQSNIKLIKSRFLANETDIKKAEIDVSSLEKNISQCAEKGKFERSVDNATQHKILDEFLKYAKMAEYSFKLTQASNYDTTSFRSTNSLVRKQLKTDNARNTNIFSSVDKLLENSFIDEQRYLLGYSSEALGEILKLDKYDFRSIINSVLRPYAENDYISNDDYERIGNKVVASFLDYIIQTKGLVNQEIKSLLVDVSSSVASQLSKAKKEHLEVRILRDLEPKQSIGREGEATSIALKVNLKEAYDENLYTDMMRELKSALPDLYENIVRLSILQGTYQSPISIKNIIPIEDYSKIIAPIVSNLIVDEDVEAFTNGAFQRNNWKDDDIFKTINPKFFTTQEFPIAEDQFGNEIYQYYSPNFPNIKQLNLKSTDRRILELNEKYNYLDVQNDFLLVPRVVVDNKTGERINMTNGQTVTNADFARRKAKGDYSLKDVFGYKKVRNIDGSPLTKTDKNGSAIYVYKLINLWGDGQYASEYYSSPSPSVLNNGTVKIDNEIPDSDIINFYSPEVKPQPIVKIEKIEPNEDSQSNIPDCI